MSSFDLKPLSNETIEQLAIDSEHLWMIKIQDQTYGPFETLSINHYAFENPDHFVIALAKRMNEEKWLPFLSHEVFKNTLFKPEVIDEPKEKQFWMLIEGQLSHPANLKEINKRIELGRLSLTDSISTDEGETWHKIYHLEEFAHKLHSSRELPVSPGEAQFNRAKIKVFEKLESQAQEVARKENMSGMAYLGQKTTQLVVLKIDEISLDSLAETEVSRSLRWAVPSAMAGILTMALTGYYVFTPAKDAPLFVDEETESHHFFQKPKHAKSVAPAPERMPSSVAPMNHHPGRSSLTQSHYADSAYPTHLETHHDIQQEADPQHEQIFDNPEPATDEQAMATQPAEEGQSLDAAMNAVPQPVMEAAPAAQEAAPEQPVVEEVSDF